MQAWYLLNCQEKTWRRTLQALDDKGIKYCCPIISETRRRTDKKTAVRQTQSPLFPGYIFTCFDPEVIHTTAVQNMYGAKQFIRFGKEIGTVADDIVSALSIVEFVEVTGNSFSCINANEDLVSRLKQIYSIKDKTNRVTALMHLVAASRSQLRKSA